jgi:hypothetical protein
VTTNSKSLAHQPILRDFPSHKKRISGADPHLSPTHCYAVSSTVLPGLPDRAAVTAEWLAYCSACPVPEIANVMSRARIPFHQVTGVGSRLEKLAKLLGIDVVRIC